jgi:hypothetical protein
MKIKRVQTLYSYKKPDGSLYLRGVYSVDSPGGIPDMIMEDAISGRKTVRVLEWAEDEPVKVEPVKVEPVEPKKAELDKEDEPEKEVKPRKKIVRKKKA